MKLSTRSLYGIKFMYVMAQNFNKKTIQITQISNHYKISEKYLSQIVIRLKQSGFIKSARGSSGGYFLVKEPESITVYEILRSLEGDLNIVDFIEDKEVIGSVREIWAELNDTIKAVLENYTLKDILDKEQINEVNFIYTI